MSDHPTDEATFSGGNEEAGSIADRGQTRYGVDLAVTVNSDSNFYAGFAKNLSEGGIFVATHIVHPVGTKFNLSLHLDDGDPKPVRGVGEVRWIRALDGDLPAGLGIQFTEVDDEARARIDKFLAKREPIIVDTPESRGDHPEVLTDGGVSRDD